MANNIIIDEMLERLPTDTPTSSRDCTAARTVRDALGPGRVYSVDVKSYNNHGDLLLGDVQMGMSRRFRLDDAVTQYIRRVHHGLDQPGERQRIVVKESDEILAARVPRPQPNPAESRLRRAKLVSQTQVLKKAKKAKPKPKPVRYMPMPDEQAA